MPLHLKLMFFSSGGSGFPSQGHRTLPRTSGGRTLGEEPGQRDGASGYQNQRSGGAAGRPRGGDQVSQPDFLLLARPY